MASIIKADNIQKVSDGSNIIKKCGSTITLGSCGATIALAAGATQTGFGQTYSAVEYCTTAKTSPFTAAAGTGYFINTTCGAVTVTLPASPTAGDVISIKDYGGTWQTNNLTLCNNGNKINGVCLSAKLSTQNQSVTLIYVDGTKGWQDIQDSTAGISGGSFITATGGTVATCGDYKIHTFTSDGTFCVSAGGGPLAVVDYLVVAGGGGATGHVGSGGGAGGARMSSGTASGCYTASPLGACVAAIPVSVQGYPITVGGGGAGVPSYCTPSNSGSNSIFSTITSAGGGGSGSYSFAAKNGGSGGGAPANNAGGNPTTVVGLGNTPPTSPPQGNDGGQGLETPGADSAGAGGGASAVGINSTPSLGGVGGAGIQNNICGNSYYWSGGGGGSAGSNPSDAVSGGSGGVGGGGGASIQGSGSGGAGGGSAINSGGSGTAGPGATGGAGGANSGGGGGGGSHPGGFGGAGGSGIVIIRYKFQ
jgi:hypothetical protein